MKTSTLFTLTGLTVVLATRLAAYPFSSTQLANDLLAGYDFGTQNSADYQDSFVQQADTTVSQFTATVGMDSSTRGAAFDADPWSSSPTDTNDLGSGQSRANFTSSWTNPDPVGTRTDFQYAVDNDEYYAFDIQADPGFSLELSEIGFLIRNDGSSAANGFSVWYSTDDFSGFTGTATSNTFNVFDGSIESQGATSDNYGSVDSSSLSDTVTNAYFRIYIFGEDGNSSQSTRIDKVYVEGAVIPEPGSLALLGVMVFALVLGLRKRRG